MEEEEYDFMLKIIIVGESQVGKTNIMSKYLKNNFDENSRPTAGVEFGAKIFKIEGLRIKAQIWDTAGLERYKAITQAYYRGAKGAFVVYDITKKQTLDKVGELINNVKKSAHKNVSIILIGNKTDLEDKREIMKEQGEEKAKKYNVSFLETSALTGENLDKAFEMLMNEIYKKEKNSDEKQQINNDDKNKTEEPPKDDLDYYKNENEKLKKENIDLKNDLLNCKNEIEKLKQENNKLKDDLDKLNNELNKNDKNN